MPLALFLILFTVIAALTYCVSGSNSLAIFAITPIVAQDGAGGAAGVDHAGLLPRLHGLRQLRRCHYPHLFGNLLVSATMKVLVTVVIKRCAVPTFLGMVCCTAAAFVLFG